MANLCFVLGLDLRFGAIEVACAASRFDHVGERVVEQLLLLLHLEHLVTEIQQALRAQRAESKGKSSLLR